MNNIYTRKELLSLLVSDKRYNVKAIVPLGFDTSTIVRVNKGDLMDALRAGEPNDLMQYVVVNDFNVLLYSVEIIEAVCGEPDV